MPARKVAYPRGMTARIRTDSLILRVRRVRPENLDDMSSNLVQKDPGRYLAVNLEPESCARLRGMSCSGSWLSRSSLRVIDDEERSEVPSPESSEWRCSHAGHLPPTIHSASLQHSMVYTPPPHPYSHLQMPYMRPREQESSGHPQST